MIKKIFNKLINKKDDKTYEFYVLINEQKDYDIAIANLKKSISQNNDFSNSLNFTLFSIQLIFLKKKFVDLIQKKDIFLESIDKYLCNKNEKKYYKCFIYNLAYLSAMLEKNYDESSENKYLFHTENVSLDTREIDESVMKIFPIYEGPIIENLFKDSYTKEELTYVIDNHIFINSEELVDVLATEYLKIPEEN